MNGESIGVSKSNGLGGPGLIWCDRCNHVGADEINEVLQIIALVCIIFNLCDASCSDADARSRYTQRMSALWFPWLFCSFFCICQLYLPVAACFPNQLRYALNRTWWQYHLKSMLADNSSKALTWFSFFPSFRIIVFFLKIEIANVLQQRYCAISRKFRCHEINTGCVCCLYSDVWKSIGFTRFRQYHVHSSHSLPWLNNSPSEVYQQRASRRRI